MMIEPALCMAISVNGFIQLKTIKRQNDNSSLNLNNYFNTLTHHTSCKIENRLIHGNQRTLQTLIFV